MIEKLPKVYPHSELATYISIKELTKKINEIIDVLNGDEPEVEEVCKCRKPLNECEPEETPSYIRSNVVNIPVRIRSKGW